MDTNFFFVLSTIIFLCLCFLIHQVGSSNLRALDLCFANINEDGREFISWIPVIIISKGAGGL